MQILGLSCPSSREGKEQTVDFKAENRLQKDCNSENEEVSGVGQAIRQLKPETRHPKPIASLVQRDT